ncbi:MAG: glutathione S-transferase [Gammaproteobacteria bacterium]|jgi:glutathione S-transferase
MEANELNEYRVIGVESSPYAVKVRAVLRYRRIPHIWVGRMPQFFAETANVRPLIMPVVQFPNGEYRTDSTPIIRDLESLHVGRSVEPDDLANNFLSDLIEDLADEWLTKCLFNYRFSSPEDQISGASWVIDDAHPHLSEEALQPLVREFIQRQVARMPLVGCTPENTPLIESFFCQLLNCLEPFAQTDRFLFGSRPSLADFGLYAQLKTLAGDPTGAKLMNDQAPRTIRWIRRLDDASGVEGEWDASRSDTVMRLIRLAGQYYLPFLAENWRAIQSGDSSVGMIIDDQTYRQPVFRYQAKCYDFLRHRFANLPHDVHVRLDPILKEADCLRFLSDR